MAQESDYIVYQPAQPQLGGPSKVSSTEPRGRVPLSEGLWQRETLGVLEMYSDRVKFSALPS